MRYGLIMEKGLGIWWQPLCGNFSSYNAFWSNNLTLYTNRPYFTSCLQDTVLTWIPATILFLLTLHEIPSLRNLPIIHSSWKSISVFCYFKTILCLVMSLLNWSRLLHGLILRFSFNDLQMTNSSFLAPAINAMAQVTAACLTLMTFRRGHHTSSVLFFYWFLSFICGSLIFVSQVNYIYSNQHLTSSEVFLVSSSGVMFFFIFVQFVATCVVDTAAFRQQQSPNEKTELLNINCKPTEHDSKKKKNPQESASFLSSALFWWFNWIVVKGFKTPLKYADIWDLSPENSTKVVVPKFEAEWKKNVRQYEKGEKTGSSKKKPSFVMTIMRTYGAYFMTGFFLMLVRALLTVAYPIILGYFIQFIKDKDTPYAWHGYILAFAMFFCTSVSILFLHNAFYIGYTTGMRLRTVVITNVYRKMLRLSCTARKECSGGAVINLMSVDAQKIQECFNWTHYSLTCPIEVGGALAILWSKIGISSLAGFIVLFVVVPVNSIYIGHRIRSAQLTQMLLKDERIKLMNQVLTGIKVLKLYAWEPYFQERILSIRNKEIKLLRKIAILSTINNVIIFSVGSVIAVLCFVTFVSISDGNILTPEITFVSLSAINMMNFPAFIIPTCVMAITQGFVSMERVREFLLLPEVDPDSVSHNYMSDTAVKTEGATFSWGDQPVLKQISAEVKTGELVAVVGRVGAGKSSFISSLLGEMEKVAGSVNIQRNIAYVPQLAWIQNLSLRDNILFSCPFNQFKYDNILEACALNADLKMLPAGDLTEIGERGINLSGGQKQRVSLARAVYQDQDIYLMDDPLSAVDAHVGKHLFEQVIGPEGLLKDKTRILATNSTLLLLEVDRILVLVDGCLVESGTYEELKEKEGAFVDYLKKHLQDEGNDDEVLMEGETDLKPEGSEGDTEMSLSGPLDGRIEGRIEGRRISEKEVTQLGAKTSGVLVQEEVAEEGTVKLSVIKAYIIAASLVYLAIASFGFTLAVGGQVSNNIWLSLWSNEVTALGNASTISVTTRIGTYGGLALVQVVGQFILSLTVCYGVIAAATNLHKELLTNILCCPMSFFDTTPLGRILNRFSKDVDTLDSDLRNYIQAWLMNVAVITSVVIIICYTTALFLVAFIPIVLTFFILQRVYVATARQLKRIDSIRRSPIYAHFSESINGASSIRAYGQEERFISQSDSLLDTSQKIWYFVFTSNRWIGIWTEFLSTLIILFAALFCVIQRESLDPGTAGLSLSFTLQVNIQMGIIVRYSCEMETYIVAVERIKEYCEVPKEAPLKIKGNQPPCSWPSEGAISFNGYCTRYRQGLQLVLKELTCNISPGEKVGIVGRTGAGKSSLALSLFRIIEAAGGSIYIDGQDISSMGLHDLRSRLTIIPQDPVLFSGSLRFNIDPSGQHTDHEVLNALNHSHLKDFVDSNPEALQYECGEDGQNLSVGQRQLVCLARALLRKTKVLVLDEATAAVDMATDDLIQKTIRTEFSNCTIVTIAHRLQTILDYDRVIVMDKGKLKEFDSPENLLATPNSIFHGMARDAGLL